MRSEISESSAREVSSSAKLGHCLVVVQAVHAGDAVAAGLAGNLARALLAEVDKAIKAVLEDVVVVHDLAALRDREAGVEVRHDRLHDVFLDLVLGHHLLVLAAHVLDGLAGPCVGQAVHRGDDLAADAVLAAHGDYVAKALGDVAAAGAKVGDLGAGLGTSGKGGLVEVGVLVHEEALGEPGQRGRATIEAGLGANEQLMRPDGGVEVLEHALQTIGAAHDGDFALVLGCGARVPVGLLHVER